MVELEELLRWYCGQGWRLVPGWAPAADLQGCSCPRGLECMAPGKHPILQGWQHAASCDWEVVAGWLAAWPGCSWGVCCGPGSNLVVVDCDLRLVGEEVVDGWANFNNWLQGFDGFELPETLVARTGSGGAHVYLQHPGMAVRNAAGWLEAVDRKGDDGFILLPPSRHVSGEGYTWAQIAPQPCRLPDHILLQICTERGTGRGPGAPSPRTGGSGGEAAYDLDYCVLHGAPAGARDHFFNAYAFKLRMQGWEADAAVNELRRVWELTEQPAGDVFEWAQVLAKLARVAELEVPEPTRWEAGTVPISPVSPVSPAHAPQGPGEAEQLTDTGNARRLIRWFGEDIRHTVGLGWWLWRGKAWQHDPKGLRVLGLTEAVVARMWAETPRFEGDDRKAWVAWCKLSESRARREAMVALAMAADEVNLDLEGWDANPWLLHVANGVLDLRTGDLREARREDLLTRRSRVEYDEAAVSTDLDHYLWSATGGDEELLAYLQRAAGYTLTGSVTEDAFFLVHGPKASGKSTFVGALETALGELARTTHAETLMLAKYHTVPANEIAMMFGARMVSTAELPEGARLNEELVKRMCGGDTLTGKFLYKDSFNFRSTFKLWLATNHAPGATDDALFRRAKMIIFPTSIARAQQDLTLRPRLADPGSLEARAFLAWAVRGCIRWQAGGLGTCAAVEARTAQWQEDEDVFGQFLEEAVEPCEGGWVANSDLRQRHEMWAARNSLKPLSPVPFSKKLSSRGWKAAKKNKVRGWEGWMLRESASDRYGASGGL